MFDLSHGFPSDWETSKLESAIIKKELQKKTYDLVINATWGFLECEHPVSGLISDKFKIVKDLVSNHNVKNILFFNFVDPLYEHSTWYEVLEHCRNILGESNITTVGFIDTNKFKQDLSIPFWAIYNVKQFERYEEENLNPTTLENLFLCYNRKPTFHRKWLHQQFEKNNLLAKGIFTLGNEDPSKVIIINKDKKTLPFQNNNIHGNLNIPNDTLTLGPLDAWNSSFIIIVTETDHNMNTAVPFLSEKIWKPLIGMRPFVCLGDKGTIDYLEVHGFKTFNNFFGFDKKDLTVDDITNLIKNYKGNPKEDFDKLKPDLIYNRRRFFEFAKTQTEALGLA
tara:strand:- start:1713 stop:2726 length:1014 start_codon:yes stop_codon:yes gene_type:complete